MAKKPSKKTVKKSVKKVDKKTDKKNDKKRRQKKEIPAYKHRSFKRSYREDYRRDLNVPKASKHVFETFKTIFRNYKYFGLLLVIMSAVGMLVMWATMETTMVFGVLIFLVIWLMSVFLVRHEMAGRKIKLRDGFFNAMTPLISVLVVFLVALVQCVPIFLLIIAYSAAIKTEFLVTPVYALMFWAFAGLMILISGYLLSSSLIALVAVSAPGLYPIKALSAASDLMVGRRVRFVLRLLVLILVVMAIWAVLVLPLSLWNLPEMVLTAAVTIVGCFTSMFVAVYLYIYYRSLIDND